MMTPCFKTNKRLLKNNEEESTNKQMADDSLSFVAADGMDARHSTDPFQTTYAQD